ncbi:MAG: M20 family metallo-hydrolase [Candidatus Aminicenantales bacterium]
MMRKCAFFLLSISVFLFFVQAARTENCSDTPYLNLKATATRIVDRLQKLAEFGKTPEGGVSRLAFSSEDIQGRQYVVSLMKEAELSIRIDAAGNIIGRREGQDPSLPPIMFGSHTDTVPNGGKFDGALGVIGAIECVQVLKENLIQTKHPLEVIVFSDEEGGSVGSRSMVQALPPEALELVSQSGKTIRLGIRDLDGDPDNIQKAVCKKGEIKAFLELHIEQGGILESKKTNIGIVEGIVGITRAEVTVEGVANHAGTTPMDMRQDALLGASHFIIAVNTIVRNMSGRQVGTVGRIKAEPGAPNVIPGKVVMSLELRDLDPEKVRSIFHQIQEEAQAIAEKTGTKISFSPVHAVAEPALTEPEIRKMIAQSAEELGLTTLLMQSGAGHDAQNMARIAPTGMIFIPSAGGISHSPKEFSPIEDIVNGCNVLLLTILKIDRN